ncbi:mpv17-like protein 2 isoform X2 [Antedon mediterranea]|uniref:mpv17-like protein 2 isoform X2 n=1 Tax=Antedon mediterranea TaxID=105859 RepID=UPI003AF5CE6D
MSSSVLPSFVRKLFSKYLLITNTVTCSSLLAIGDVIEQTREIRRNRKNESHASKHHHSYNWKRTGRMACIGLALGPFNHYWYFFLDRFLPGTSGKMVIKKILLDQVVAAPFFNGSFILGMGLLEGKSLTENLDNFKSKFPTLYLMDWCIWPVAQAINFTFIPSYLRVTYVNFITLGWDAVLSFVQFDMTPKKDKDIKIL